MKHLLQGWRDFFLRYFNVFKSVWSVRKQLDAPDRTADERAFLPAHLELIESPTSPTARWTMRIIIAFFCVALLWACLGKLDIVAVAPGKTVVDSRTKVVQTAETAVVRRILVRDGQAVKRGQLLVELDATATGAEFVQAGDSLVNARLTVLRQSALARAIAYGQSPKLDAASDLNAERVATEQQLVVSQFDAFQARRHNLQASIAQRQAELRTVQDEIGPLAESARISKIRAEDYNRLLEGKYVGRHEYLLREQERISAESQLATQRNRLQEIRSAISAAQEELRVLVTDTRQQALDAVRQANEQVGQLAQDVAKTGQRDKLMALRAPVDGTVQQLAVHTVGGVVTPAQSLLVVVPAEEALEVEVTVLNKDIGFMRPGQPVTVKIDSFPCTRYGYLTGSVASVSHDAAQDEKLGLVFPARIKLDGSMLEIEGVKVRMSAGMSLSAEIKTGKRRVIDYLFSPLRQHASESLRER
ncbi:HlyD family type I secretion periplasmic adaptor subunit [Xanthomonas translucens]|uniref:Membrane fusion protein (MFP) family protein n=1 Tax=Xanthomonas translucens pv. translucens DSM 18974 TaxID=1261556 RepID=A0A1C3TK26_XANCT|nr:HlyD family type I secretion periplasmic adaptor subunit [Xanthomonas translucens]KTF39849.1 hemolysin secretion protein D [Xanthomonas translucens pv. translucens]KWV13568.1 hemolysin secretion protein D [Xanthomonas translucens]MCC8446869.1 HlyD family type I secretion periplasmic adaptor subunit [Xanthomonas translucens pv. translucens]MCS3360858.1 HlyD family type I secretion periplasmic adaptor subunit [Xanthomonas translucens pv. translucens]MCS3374731.1 HlyD family type I secretion p